MACKVNYSLLVCCGSVVYFQFVVIGECIDYCHVEVAGEALFHVGRKIMELECLAVGLLCVPYSCVESCRAAMKVVRTVVDCKIVLLAVDCELAFTYSVAVASYQCAEERFGAIQEVVDAVMSLYYIGVVAVLVGNHDAANRSTVVCYCNFAAFLVLENEKSGFLAANDLFEVGGLEL